jgi:GT2 family glycosyltransferase
VPDARHELEADAAARAPLPLISVVIVAFNSGRYIEQCLDSIRASETSRFRTEIIVVDNASTDGTAAWVEQAAGDGVRLVKNSENVGFAKAANIGIRASSGDYVLLLNPDTAVSPRAISTALDFLQTHPGAGIVTVKLELQDGRIDPGCHRGFPTPWASLTYLVGLERLFPKWRLVNGYHRWDLPLDRAHEVDAISGAFMLVRRQLLCDVGLFDERFFMYAEDVDLCLRAREAGYRVYFQPSETVLHVKGTSTGIKRHSAHFSQADLETRSRALNAFYDSTKAFFDKHYAAKYPRPLKWAVHATVEAARPVANFRLRRRMKGVKRSN